ncbi:MAG: sodium:solute symporter family protein [Gemmatimonadetes bacterium]|nr:sodium:solute symporter family protein [Gemmatimonadota bacterium]
MERWLWITSIIVLYLGATLAIGFRAGRRSSESVTGYVAADRSFGLVVMYFVTGASVFSAFAFLGGPGWAYSRGAAAFYILAYGALGMAPFYWWGPRVAALGRRFGFVTQAQLVTGRFRSRELSLLMALISIVAFVPYVSIQMRGAGIVINAVTDGNVPLWVGALAAYGIVTAYVLRSGAMAVGWTNTFQGVFMVVIAWSLGLYLPYHLYGGIGPMFEGIADARPELLAMPGLTASGSPWTWGAFSSVILASAVGLMMWPHLFMKAFTAKDDATLRRTVVLFPTFQLFLIPIFLIGFAGVLFAGRQGGGPVDSDSILPFMILETGMPVLVVGLFCAGALSASMSTGDALMHAAASVFVEDGVALYRQMDERARRSLIRITVLVTGTLAYVFALQGGTSLVQILLSAYGPISQLAPPVFAALYWRRATTPGVAFGLLAGVATSVFFFLNPDLKPFDIHEGVLGLAIQLPVLVGVSLTTRRQDPEHVADFVEGGR